MQYYTIPNLPDDEPLTKVRKDRRKQLGILLYTHPVELKPFDKTLKQGRNASWQLGSPSNFSIKFFFIFYFAYYYNTEL